MNVYSLARRALLICAAIVPTLAAAQGSAPPSTLSLIVKDPTALASGDQVIFNKLVSLGHTVVLHASQGITVAATDGSDAVLIAGNVVATEVRATFRGDPRPVMVWRPQLYDDMGMTGVVADVDYGTALDQSQVDIIDNSDTIGSGLPLGPILTTTRLHNYTWGMPGGDARVVATLLGDAARATIFTYAQGDRLADGSPAAGKRIGFFLRNNTANWWSPAGEQLFEQSLEWMLTVQASLPTVLAPPVNQSVVDGSTVTFSVVAGGHPFPTYQWQRNGVDIPGETNADLTFVATPANAGSYRVVLTNSEGVVKSDPGVLNLIQPRVISFVVNDATALVSGDQAIVAALEAVGHTVVVHSAAGLTLGATAGSDAVLVGGTVVPNDIGVLFRNDTRPVMLWQPRLFDDMGMTGIVTGSDYGSAAGQSQLELLDNPTVIGDGFTPGPVLATTRLQNFAWGVPGSTAHVVATLVGNSTAAAIFGYDEGTILIDGTFAMGRRLGFFLRYNTAAVWAPSGKRLFEQSVLWLFGDGPPDPFAPVILAQPGDAVVNEDSVATFSVSADGYPGPTYQWQYNGFDLPGETDAVLSFTATLADAGDYRVVVTNSEGSVASDIAMLNVLNVNDPPVFMSGPVTTATQNAPYLYSIMAGDPDEPFGDTLTIATIDAPAWLTLQDNGDGTAALAGTPGPLDVGPHNVMLEVRDSFNLTAMQSFVIDVADVNDPPSFSSTPITTANDGAMYAYNVAATDIDPNDTLIFAAVTKPAWLTLVNAGGGTAVLHGIPAQGDIGSHAVTLRVTDAAGASAQQSFTITVIDVNNIPQFISRPITATTEGQTYLYAIVATDSDGDAVRLRSQLLPPWLTLTNNGDGTGELLGTPGGSDLGFHSVELIAEDDTGTLVAAQSFTILVNPATDGPVITLNGNPEVVIRQGESYKDAGATAMDPQDGDLTSIIAVDNPVNSSVLGTYIVAYSVTDTAGNQSQARRTVIVQRQADGGGGSTGWWDLFALLGLGLPAAWRRRRRPGSPAAEHA
jgi:Bacterial surface protein, Ig-like domain/Putative Ig domain/Immunoglobulin domain